MESCGAARGEDNSVDSHSSLNKSASLHFGRGVYQSKGLTTKMQLTESLVYEFSWGSYGEKLGHEHLGVKQI